MPSYYNNSIVARVNVENYPHIRAMAEKTATSPGKVINTLLAFAISRAMLRPSGRTVYDLRFRVTDEPSVENALSFFPQLEDRYSGLRSQ